MNELTEQDYLDYQSPEVLKIKKSLSRIRKFFSILNTSIQTSVGLSMIPILIFLALLKPDNPNGLYYIMASFCWMIAYVFYMSDVPSRMKFFDQVFYQIFFKSFLSKKLKQRFNLLFNSNNKIQSIFLKRSHEFTLPSKKEEYLVDLYDFLKNVENKTLSKKDIEFFFKQDEVLSDFFNSLKEEQEKKQKVKIMNHLVLQKNTASNSNITNLDIITNNQQKPLSIEQEFNFNKV